jgi:transcription elongation factor Elf1
MCNRKGADAVINYPPAEEQVVREISEYAREDEKIAVTLQLYAKVYEIHRKCTEFIGKAFLPVMPKECSFEEGIPLLGKSPLCMPPDLLQSMLSLVIEAARQYNRENSDTAISLDETVLTLCTEENIRDFFSCPDNLTDEGIRSFLAGHGVSEGNKENLAMMAFLVRMAVKPFYVVYAGNVKDKHNFKLWTQGNCPVCGQKPMLAMLRKDDGARVLECGLCHTSWQFYRLVCPDCGNKDQDSLGFFFLPQKEYRRVYVCNKCKYYLKTTVLRELGRDIIPELENAATFYLDYLAHKEGYKLAGSKNVTH